MSAREPHAARSSRSVPTENQYRRLRVLGSGAALVIGTRRDIKPLLRRGWVTAEDHVDHFAWVRLTPDGLRALALAVEKFGWPAITRREKEEASRAA